jgi:hypothetical protein
MEYFKIVPIVSEWGLHYEVHNYRKGFFGTKHLGPLRKNGCSDYLAMGIRVEGSPELFKTVKEATCFIRKHYGEQASIKPWRQL